MPTPNAATTSAPHNHRFRKTGSPKIPSRPRWDADTRTLFLGGVVVKAFRQPAAIQEMILAALEEEGWPHHLDDPLPPIDGLNSKVRLHQAINNLNRAMLNPLIRFHGDGKGSGLYWSLVTRKTVNHG